MSARAGGNGCVRLSGTPLVYAGQVWHRVLVNKERPMKVAHDLGISKTEVVGVCKILRAAGYVPSAERLAVAAMIIPDVTDEDIADWFGRDESWAADVRFKADYWREQEYFPERLEYIGDGYHKGDPSPEDIYRKAAEIRELAPRQPERQPRVGMPNFSWDGSKHAFFSISVE